MSSAEKALERRRSGRHWGLLSPWARLVGKRRRHHRRWLGRGGRFGVGLPSPWVRGARMPVPSARHARLRAPVDRCGEPRTGLDPLQGGHGGVVQVADRGKPLLGLELRDKPARFGTEDAVLCAQATRAMKRGGLSRNSRPNRGFPQLATWTAPPWPCGQGAGQNRRDRSRALPRGFQHGHPAPTRPPRAPIRWCRHRLPARDRNNACPAFSHRQQRVLRVANPPGPSRSTGLLRGCPRGRCHRQDSLELSLIVGDVLNRYLPLTLASRPAACLSPTAGK